MYIFSVSHLDGMTRNSFGDFFNLQVRNKKCYRSLLVSFKPQPPHVREEIEVKFNTAYVVVSKQSLAVKFSSSIILAAGIFFSFEMWLQNKLNLSQEGTGESV